MNFLTNTYKVGHTLVPPRKENHMSIHEIKINKVINSKKRKPEYQCSIKYQNGKIESNIKLKDQTIQKFSLKLRDLLAEL